MADELLNIVTKVNSAIRSDKGRKLALTTVLAQHKPRIFSQGLASDGSQIGTYSKKYGEYKSSIGKNPGYVNLRNTDHMMGDYGMIVSGDQYAFGFQNPENAKKMGFLTDKYNKEIAHLSEPELDVLMTVLVEDLSKSI